MLTTAAVQNLCTHTRHGSTIFITFWFGGQDSCQIFKHTNLHTLFGQEKARERQTENKGAVPASRPRAQKQSASIIGRWQIVSCWGSGWGSGAVHEDDNDEGMVTQIGRSKKNWSQLSQLAQNVHH